MTKAIETRLLEAYELFQYSYRFRSSVFVIAITSETDFSSLLLDLKLLLTARISVLIIAQDSSEIRIIADKLVKRGEPFKIKVHGLGKDSFSVVQNNIIPAFKDEAAVLLILQLHKQQTNNLNAFLETCSQFASLLNADKLFIVSQHRGLEVKDKFRSHLSVHELEKIINNNTPCSLSHSDLSFLLATKQKSKHEIVLLDAVVGSLFEEVFTHRGHGTLITDDYPNRIRRAQLRDTSEIYRLLAPNIKTGAVLLVTEDEIAADIRNYFVYSVNNAIVAASQLVDFGNCYALAKFSTLPRYQGRGRAKQLARKMIKIAKKEGKAYVFALSIEPKMWDFFLSLGFYECAREELPEKWKEGYDFSRPSRAYRLDIADVLDNSLLTSR